MLETILETFPDEEFVKIDGYDDAILGSEESANGRHLLCSLRKVFEFMEKFNLTTDEDKIEWYSYNMISLSAMNNGPLFLEDILA